MKSNLPSITCLIPAFDRPDFLQRALLSVYSQTLRPTQVVVSENGTNPAIAEVVSKFHDYSPTPIHLTSTLKIPALDNWLRGANEAVGEYTKIVWDDDWLESNCLERMLELAVTHEADVVMSAAWMVLPEGKFLAYLDMPLKSESIIELLPLISQRKLPNSPLASLIRTKDLVSAFSFASYPAGSISDGLVVGPDLAANFWGVFRGGKFVYTPEPLVYMFSDGNNMTQMNIKKLPKYYRGTLKNLLSYHRGEISISERLLISLWSNSKFIPSSIIIRFAKLNSR